MDSSKFDQLTETMISVIGCISSTELNNKELMSLTHLANAVSATLASKLSSPVMPINQMVETAAAEMGISNIVMKPTHAVLNDMQYNFLKTIYDKGLEYTNLKNLSMKLIGNTDFHILLKPVRKLLKEKKAGCTIYNGDKDNCYKLRREDLPVVRDLLSESCYSRYASYCDYNQKTANKTSVPATKNILKVDPATIIDAISTSTNINVVLQKLNLRSSGGNYDRMRKYIEQNNLKLGSAVYKQKSIA
jgi:hypothetical protein